MKKYVKTYISKKNAFISPRVTLESRVIGRVEIIGGLDIVIIINNRGGWEQ